MDVYLHVLRFYFTSRWISYHQCHFCKFVFNWTPRHPSGDKDLYSEFMLVIMLICLDTF